MNNNLNQLQPGDVVAYNARFTKSVKDRAIRKALCAYRGKVMEVLEGGVAVIQWKGEAGTLRAPLDTLALYYRARVAA